MPNWVNLVLLLSIVIVIGITFVQQKRLSDDGDAVEDPYEELKRAELITNATFLIGLLFWPVLWTWTVGDLRIVQEKPLAAFGFLWPIILNFVLMLSTPTRLAHRVAQKGHPNGIFARIGPDVTAMISIAFALGTLLLQHHSREPPTASTKVHHDLSRRLLFFVLIFAVAFMVPTKDLLQRPSGFVFETAQRVMLNYAVGLMITSLAVNI